MNKIIKKINKQQSFVFLVFCTYMLTSCVMDRITSFGIRNSSNDTLYIELSESDSLDNLTQVSDLEFKPFEHTL